jgi:hypothetical protein
VVLRHRPLHPHPFALVVLVAQSALGALLVLLILILLSRHPFRLRLVALAVLRCHLFHLCPALLVAPAFQQLRLSLVALVVLVGQEGLLRSAD